MSAAQIVLSAILTLIVLLIAKRQWSLRGLTRYSPADVADRMKRSGATVLLDVRTSAERSRNNIKGSIHIPLHEIGRRMSELEKYKGKEIICYCQSGNRSLVAAARLKRLGFTTANLDGGIVEWNSSGLR